MREILSIINKVRTPISVSCFIIAILYGVYIKILELKIFSLLGESNTYYLISNILNKIFILALLGLLIAGLAYLYQQYIDSKSLNRKSKIEVIDITIEDRKMDNEKNV